MCTKTGLIRTLKNYYYWTEAARTADYRVFNTTATSFLLVSGSEDSEYIQFVSRFKDLQEGNYSREQVPAKHCKENMWLLKPANMNQGRGIEVFRNWDDILNAIGSKPSETYWVVQKYIERPLLYLGRKFDIRVWVLITNKREVFFYKHGYIRTSSDTYDTKNKNNYVHLTNNCLQKFGDNYGKHEEGNTLSFNSLLEFLKQTFPNLQIDFEKHVVSKMKDFVIDSYLSWKKNLNPNKRKNVFELFGYDFLLDEDLRTWLIEINTNPYLGVPNDFIADLLPKMVDDMLDIVLDPLFPPINDVRNGRANDFDLIYCEGGSVYSDKPLNVRSPFYVSRYPFPELDPKNTGQEANKGGVEYEARMSKTNQLRSSSVESNTDNKIASYHCSLEIIFKNLYNHINFRAEINPEVVNSHLTKILGALKNWELLSSKHISLACKSLHLIANSAANVILSDQNHILSISKLLSSENMKLEIQLAAIEAFNCMAKDIVMKKKLMCNKIIHDLINIAISSCDEKEIDTYCKELRIAALKSLQTLAKLPSAKTYIPGETREQFKVRYFFLSQGGAIAFAIISKMALEEDIKQLAAKDFLRSLDFQEWEKQLEILETFQQFHLKEKIDLVTDFAQVNNTKSPKKLSILIENGSVRRENISPFGMSSPVNNQQGTTIFEEGKTIKLEETPGSPFKTDISKNLSPHNVVFYKTGDFRINKEKALERMLTFPSCLFKYWSFEQMIAYTKENLQIAREEKAQREKEAALKLEAEQTEEKLNNKQSKIGQNDKRKLEMAKKKADDKGRVSRIDLARSQNKKFSKNINGKVATNPDDPRPQSAEKMLINVIQVIIEVILSTSMKMKRRGSIETEEKREKQKAELKNTLSKEMYQRMNPYIQSQAKLMTNSLKKSLAAGK